MELENQNSYAGGTEIYEGTLKVDAIGDQSLYTTAVGGATTAQNTYGSLGVSVRVPVSAFLGWTNSVNVYGGILAQAAPNTNSVPITVYSGATNAISLSAANLQLREGTSGQTETIFNSSTNFVLTYNSGTRLQFVYANVCAPSATVAVLLATNAYSAANLALVANGTVTRGCVERESFVGQFPLIEYSGTVGGIGGSAFVLGTIEPHAGGYISNNVLNSSIDLVITNITQPLIWNGGTGTWNIGSTANWNDNLGAATTYQQVGSLADNVIFDDSSSGTPPFIVTLNANPIPNSVTVNNASKTYTLSGNGSISGLGSVTKTGTGMLFLQTTNTFTGGLNINGGILNFTTITNLGDGGVNFGGGTLQFASGTVDDISARPVTFKAGGGTIDLNGNAVTFANPIGNNGAGGFTLAGNNTLQINGTNLYSGNTIINSGSTLAFQSASTYVSNSAALVVNGTLNASANVNPNGFGLTLSTPVSQKLVGTGAVKGEISMGSGTTISPATNGTVGTLTVNGDLTVNGGTLAMDIVAPSGGSRDSLVVNNTGFGNGNLTLGSGLNAGSIQLNITGGNLGNGSYPLISYSGGLIGAAGFLSLNGFNQIGQLAYLSSSAPNNGSIVLNVISGNTNNDVWVGGLNGNAWDVAATANWITNGVAGGTFANGNTVTFDDSASSGNTTVGLKSVLLPVAMKLNVTNNNYTFQDGSGTGAGLIVGSGSLAINGPPLPTVNTTTILTPNGNSGPTTINGSGSTLLVGNGSVTGDIGSGNITNNGTLIFDQTDNRIVLGQISGSGSLIQEGATVLTLGANNTYTGLTIISNATSTLQIGSGGAAGTLGTGAVTDNGMLAFNRSGSVTVANISGSGSVAVAGASTVALSGLTYQGNTFITNGSLTLTAANQIPNGATVAGSAGVFGLGSTLNLNGFNQTVNGLADLGVTTGLITNTAASGTNVLTIGIPLVNTTNLYTGLIMDNTNRARIQLVLNGPGTVQLAAANTYSGGTIVGSGGTLMVGTAGTGGINGNTAAGSGSITMSNGTTLYMNGNAITFPTEPLIIAPNSTVTLNSQTLGNGYSGPISGPAGSTNVIAVPLTVQDGGPGLQYMGFSGTVLVPSTANLRIYGNTGGGALSPCGGTNTTFDLEGTGSLQARTTETVFLGALVGNGAINGPQSGGVNVGNIVIGSKGTDSTYIGSISGANNIFKTGAGTLTLDGSTNSFTTTINGDGSITTNYIATNGLSYVGTTTISNGVLAIVAPANLNGANFTSFTLAGSTAVLDLSSMGYTPDGTNYLTNSVLTLGSPQTLTGIGTIRGSVVASNGVAVSVGFQSNTNGSPVTGLLTVTNSIELGGVVNLNLNGTNSPNSGEIAANSFTIDGTATLVVTNVGPGLFNGTTFTLFSQGVSGFASKTLPATDPTGLTNYVWTDTISSNGKITLASGGLTSIATNPTNILFSVTNGTLTLSWPADHVGWFLQAQTNLLTTGLSTNWANVLGSDQTNLVVMPINPANGTVFYRMIH